ncbi:hypothetical protein SUDANB126_00002 [Streptomyces sp. enrichment culture]
MRGSSLRGLVSRMRSKQAMEIGEIGASAPPASTTSALPSRTSSQPCPIASRPEVQPLETRPTGPCAPHARATSAARDEGTK